MAVTGAPCQKRPRLAADELADIRGKLRSPTPLAVFAGLERDVDRLGVKRLLEEASRPWQSLDVMLQKPMKGMRWTALPEKAGDPIHSLGWEVCGAAPCPHADPRAFLGTLRELCEKRLSRGHTAEPPKPSMAARGAKRLVASRASSARLHMHPLRLAQAASLGIWGLSVRDVAAACAFPSAQRRLLCEFLAFQEAVILQQEAWDRVVLALLPRLLPVEDALLLPRNRCWEGASVSCGCSHGCCWCGVRCVCQNSQVPSSLDAQLWSRIRQSAWKPIMGLQAGAAAVLVPAELAPGGLPVRTSDAFRLLCRHADTTTAALSWAHLPSECPEEEERRERLHLRRAAIAGRSAQLFTEALLRAGVKDPAKIAGAVQTGLYRSRSLWDERMDSMTRTLGASADALVKVDTQVSRPKFRPVRSKSPGPQWLRELPCGPGTRKVIKRLYRVLPGTRAQRGAREKDLQSRLAAARQKAEEEVHIGWRMRKRLVEQAIRAMEKHNEVHVKAQQKIEKARLEQRGLKPANRRHGGARRPHHPATLPNAGMDVEDLCAKGDWKSLFGEPLLNETVQKTRYRYAQKLLQLREEHPKLADDLVRLQRAAVMNEPI